MQLHLPLRWPRVLLEKMPRLSNFFRPRDRSQSLASAGVIYRLVQRQEIESALRLILATDAGLANDETVLDFLAFAVQRKIDVNQIWVAQLNDRIAWALLPITSPGRTMLLFTPGRIPTGTSKEAASELTEQVCAYWAGQDMHLAQFLLDPRDTAVRDLYTACGFNILAELIYLHKPVTRPQPDPISQGFELVSYSPQTHALFAATILKSYEGSLDCPSLNGKRNIEDVILGHRSTGIFDPGLWNLIVEKGEPRGVLILSPAQHSDAMELVYLGLTPDGRHRGLGDALMRHALNCTAQADRSELSLAVDAQNTPALKLYYRHGLKRIGSRMAMVRELKNATETQRT